MSDQAPEALWIPFLALSNEEDPKAFVVPGDAQREALVRAYKSEKILEMFDALTWALAHPDFPFLKFYTEFMPEMDHDNATIIEYFKKLHEGMKPVVDKLRPPSSP